MTHLASFLEPYVDQLFPLWLILVTESCHHSLASVCVQSLTSEPILLLEVTTFHGPLLPLSFNLRRPFTPNLRLQDGFLALNHRALDLC